MVSGIGLDIFENVNVKKGLTNTISFKNHIVISQSFSNNLVIICTCYLISFAILVNQKLVQSSFEVKKAILTCEAAIICGKKDCKRGEELLTSWVLEYHTYFPNSQVKFYMTGENDLLKGISTTINTGNNIYEYRDAYYLDLVSLREFLDSGYPWHIRTHYDTFINSQNLYEYIKNLSIQYNPYSDIIIKGQLNNHTQDTYFVHGGSGWIMSRKAAEIYLEHERQFTSIYEANKEWGDDILINYFMKFANLNATDVNCPYFVGSPLDQADIDKLQSGFYSFPQCPEIHCSLSDVIAWHSGDKDNFAVRNGKSLIAESPKNLHITTFHHKSKLCISV